MLLAYVWGSYCTIMYMDYSVGPVIRKQDFQIARRFLKTDAFPGGGLALPQESIGLRKKAGDFLSRKFLMTGPTLYKVINTKRD